METVANFYYTIPGALVIFVALLARVSCLLMIFFSSKYRSGYPKAGWYIFGLFFPFIAGIIFFVRRKEMGSPDMKACPVCKSKYPKDFTYCHKCNVELGEYDEKKKNAQKALAVLFTALFFVSCAVSLADEVVGLAVTLFADINDEQEYYNEPGIEVDGAYFDRDGNSYFSFREVPFYTKDGKKLVYSNATERYESKELSLSLDDCVFDRNGFLSETPASELEPVEQKSSGDIFYLDADNNRYYPARLIGWNEKGEFLLRSEADGLDYEVLKAQSKGK